jgi:branched-chain amino acid transport system ATP-binding protein
MAVAAQMEKPSTAQTGAILTVNNIEVIYDQIILVLKGVSLDVPKGGIVALLGANGAGKTTTLKAISGLVSPSDGRLIFEGEDITTASARRILQLGIAHCPEGRRVFPT